MTSRVGLLLVALLCYVWIGVDGLQVIPSLSPLKYITPDAVVSYITENFESTIWSSLLPIDQQDALAIFISEGVSGFLGGVALKGNAPFIRPYCLTARSILLPIHSF